MELKSDLKLTSLIKFFSKNMIVHVLYIEILKTGCKNNISLKRYCILKIGYLNKTLLFERNVAFSNFHIPLSKSAFEIGVLLRMGIVIFKRPHLLF